MSILTHHFYLYELDQIMALLNTLRRLLPELRIKRYLLALAEKVLPVWPWPSSPPRGNRFQPP